MIQPIASRAFSHLGRRKLNGACAAMESTRWIPIVTNATAKTALLILFLMAATSHDFWLHNLTAPVWKRLHMLVYVAYGLLIAHVTLGVLQSETSPLLAAVLALGLTTVTALHLASAAVERRSSRSPLRFAGASRVLPGG